METNLTLIIVLAITWVLLGGMMIELGAYELGEHFRNKGGDNGNG